MNYKKYSYFVSIQNT